MTQPYIAQIILFPYSFAPRDWAFCEGQTQAITQNTALFSLIGTTYGGDGVQTFALPNLFDRTALHAGQGAGLSNYVLAQTTGQQTVTLTVPQLPAHNHLAYAGTSSDLANEALQPVAGGWFATKVKSGELFSDKAPNASLNQSTLAVSGGSQPHQNMQPYLGLHYCIALYGIFPSRN